MCGTSVILPGKQGISIVATVIIGILAFFVGGLLLGLFAYRNASGGIPWLGWLVGAIFAAIGITIYGRMRGSRA